MTAINHERPRINFAVMAEKKSHALVDTIIEIKQKDFTATLGTAFHELELSEPPRGFFDFDFDDSSIGNRTAIRQKLEILFAHLPNEAVWDFVERYGSTVSQRDLLFLFPDNSQQYASLLGREETQIRRDSALLGIPLPDVLAGLERPVHRNPVHDVFHEIQEFLLEQNTVRKSADPKSDTVLAWIKGGMMPHAARVLTGPMFVYPSVTPKYIADDLHITTAFRVGADKAASAMGQAFERYARDPIMKYFPKMIAQVGKEFIPERIADVNQGYTDRIDQTRSLLGYLLRPNLPSYKSDIDILFSLPPEETAAVAFRIAQALQSKNYEVRTVRRTGSFDPQLQLLEMFVKLGDGTEQAFEFQLNPNHEVKSKNPSSHQGSLAVDVAYEMTAYQGMRLVFNGEEIRFWDPYNSLRHRGQRIGINPLFEYNEPPHFIVLPFYTSAYAALSNTERLTQYDTNLLRDSIGLYREMIRDGSYSLPHPARLILYALHNAQKAMRAQNAGDLLMDGSGDASRIFDRLTDLWGDIGLFDFIDFVAKSHSLSEDLMKELKRVFPNRYMVNFAAPDAESTVRAGDLASNMTLDGVLGDISDLLCKID
jgi:hypothetical protein